MLSTILCCQGLFTPWWFLIPYDSQAHVLAASRWSALAHQHGDFEVLEGSFSSPSKVGVLSSLISVSFPSFDFLYFYFLHLKCLPLDLQLPYSNCRSFQISPSLLQIRTEDGVEWCETEEWSQVVGSVSYSVVSPLLLRYSVEHLLKYEDSLSQRMNDGDKTSSSVKIYFIEAIYFFVSRLSAL